MAYTIRLTNGSILVTLPDQQSDSVTTSLTLIGKNVNAYGTDINQNFIRLAENFANHTAPTSPLVGQTWFDTISQQLKVYSSSRQFKSIGIPHIGPDVPTTMAVGDFWYDTVSQQLKYQRDAGSLVTIGPEYDASVGKTGFVTETFTTNLGATKTAVGVYSNDVMLGLFSDQAFTIDSANTTTSIRNVVQGFNPVYDWNNQVTWAGTATYANYIMLNGTPMSPDAFLLDRSPYVELTNPLKISTSTDGPLLSIGEYGDFQFYSDINSTTATMFIGGQNQNLDISINGLPNPVIHLDGTTGAIGIFTGTSISSVYVSENPSDTPVGINLDVNGSVLVRGNLVVNGTQTSIKARDIGIIDPTITLGWSTGTTYDSQANGGGLLLRGTTTKYMLWNQSTQSWDFSENSNLINTSSAYMIAGQPILTQNTLSSSVQYATGLTQIGKLTSATIAQLSFKQTGVYSAEIGIDQTVATSATIVIGNAQTTGIDFAGKRVANVATPSPSDSAAIPNVGFVMDAVNAHRNFRAITSIDVTGHGDNPTDPAMDQYIIQLLTLMLDPNSPEPYEAPEGMVVRVMCTKYAMPAQPNVPSNYLDPGIPVYVDQGGIQNAVVVMGYDTALRVTTNIPSTLPTVLRCIKQYIVVAGAWNPYITSGSSNVIYSEGAW